MEDKIGVFICTGYGIAEALDIEALTKVVTGEHKIPYCKTIDTCEGNDLVFINKEIKSDGLTRILIAGISPRRYADGIFPEHVMVEIVSLLEHVVWSQPPNEEDTQMLAEDYLRMYLTKLQKMEAPTPFSLEHPIDKKILVVGGGVAGLTAALEAAKTGYQVRLVEKSDELGGWLAKQYKSIPTKTPFRELEDTNIDTLIDEVKKSPHIKIYKSAKIGKISGGPGMFEVTLKPAQNGNGDVMADFRVGSIVQATGWSPEEIRDDLPYVKSKDIVRNIEVEEMMKKDGKIVRPSDGKPVKSIAFIQCAGSRNKEHLTHCSSICCLTSLKQAMYLRESGVDTKAYVFYEFLKTPGHYEDFYRRAQEDPGIFLTKGDITNISQNAEGKLVVQAENTMPGANIQVQVDLVVLATGMKPNSADGEAIRALEDAKITVTTGESDIQRDRAKKTVEELKHHEGTEILNLAYRQGPDLPALKYGYPDSHFICFPYETRRTGIYAAGCVRQPMDSIGSREDAGGAALKAIQCVEMTARGESVHPRSGDTSYPEFFLQRCTQCKRCTEECPFGVLNEDEKGTPEPFVTRCRRCGTCLGACPERIISFKDYSVTLISSMIKAVEIPDEYDEKPRILVLMCENDAIPALELAGQHRLEYSPFVRIIPVRCLGSVNLGWIRDALSAGFDGAIMIGCKYGDDYQCHFIKGSELANSRSDNIREALEKLSLENERVELHQLQISEYAKIPEIFNNFAEIIEEIGMNPFKGM